MHELSGATESMVDDPLLEALPTVTYEIVRHRGHWKVLHVGKHSAPYPNQKAAIESAMKLAMEHQATGRSVAVRLNRTDGRIFDLISEGT